MMDRYRKLEIISCSGRDSLDASDVEERIGRISEEEVIVQEGWFGDADLDIPFLRAGLSLLWVA